MSKGQVRIIVSFNNKYRLYDYLVKDLHINKKILKDLC